MTWHVKDGEGFYVGEDTYQVDTVEEAAVFETKDDARFEAERLEYKFDTPCWYRPVWEPRTPEEIAQHQKLYDLLKDVLGVK